MYNLFFRALARIGNAYVKKEDYEKALTYFNKSLSEHRVPDIVKKTVEVSIGSILTLATT